MLTPVDLETMVFRRDYVGTGPRGQEFMKKYRVIMRDCTKRILTSKKRWKS